MIDRSPLPEECRRVRELLDRFLEGALNAPDAEEVAEHLDSCASCQSLTVDTELGQRMQQGATLESAPASLEQRIRESLRQESGGSFRRRRPVILAAAAMLLIGLNAASFFKAGILPHEFVLAELRIRASLERIHELLGVGLGDHMICTVYRRLAEEPPSQASAVEEMGAEWAPLAEVAKQAAPEGFEVRLAHRCKYGGREFVHVALFDGENLASLIITARQAGDSVAESSLTAERVGDANVYRTRIDEFGISAFETDAHLAYLVSDLSAAEQAEAAAAMLPPVSSFLASIVSSPTTGN